MTAPFHVRVLQVPSSTAAAWRSRIAETCHAQDWDFHVFFGGDHPPIAADRNCVIVGWDDTELTLPATHWMVLSCSPDEAVSMLQHDLNLSRDEAIYHASGRFALGSQLVGQGAAVFQSRDLSIVVPGLGPVAAPDVHSGTVWDRTPELGFYDSLPPVSGSMVHWPSSRFNYPDARPLGDSPSRFALLGRRRLLLNGPNIALPPGTWTARATFAIKPRDKADLLFEWGHGLEVEAFSKIFDHDGRYALDITKTWTTAAPADFRISLMMPMLEGEFEFHGLDLTLASPAA